MRLWASSLISWYPSLSLVVVARIQWKEIGEMFGHYRMGTWQVMAIVFLIFLCSLFPVLLSAPSLSTRASKQMSLNFIGSTFIRTLFLIPLDTLCTCLNWRVMSGWDRAFESPLRPLAWGPEYGRGSGAICWIALSGPLEVRSPHFDGLLTLW